MKTIAILIIVTSHSLLGSTKKPTGVWLEELAVPYQIFKHAGYEITIATVNGNAISVDPRSLSEKPSTQVSAFLNDTSARSALKNPVSLGDIDMKKFDAVYMPGGHGAMWDFPKSEELKKTIETFYQSGRVVAAVCHGPAGLVSAQGKDGKSIVNGKKIAVFTNKEERAVGLEKVVPFMLETRLRQLGAEIITADNFEENAIKDKNLITGQNPASSKKVAELVKESLGD